MAGGRKAAPGTGARRDKVAELATENAALKGHIRTLILAGEAVLFRMNEDLPSALLPHLSADQCWGEERNDLKAAIDAAKLAK